MINSASVQHQVQSSIDQALVKTESLHEKIATKPLELWEKAPVIGGVASQVKRVQLDAIHKVYRGLRDLNEMNGMMLGRLLGH